MLIPFRSFTALAVLALTLLVAAAPAAAQEDTPVGGLQQLPRPNDCISTTPAAVEGEEAECGTVISGGTNDAVSIAVTPDGESAYVAASGSENGGSLATFSRNPSTGELSYNACVRDPSSNEPCGAEVTQLDGARYVVATNEHVYVAAADSGAIRWFTRNTDTGALTPGGCIQATGAGGCTDGDNGLAGVQYLVLSPDNEYLYAISETSDRIVVLDRNPSTGALTQTAHSVTEDGVRAADISSDGEHLYAVSPVTDRLIRYDRDNATGAIVRAECFRDPSVIIEPADCTETANGLDGAYDVEVVTTGAQSDVYVVAREQAEQVPTTGGGSTLTRFERDTTTGALTFGACVGDNESTDDCGTGVVGIRDATSITARPDGAFLYVTGPGDDAIAYFSRNTSDGTISQSGAAGERCVSDGDSECDPDDDKNGLTDVNESAVSPDGRFLYSTSPTDDAVAEFAIQYAPSCPNITRNDVPFNTTVDIRPSCTDLNEPRDTLTIEVRSQPDDDDNPGTNEGTVTAVDTDGDGRNDTLRYDPPDNFVGTTSFTYRAVDSQGNPSPDATVTVTVLASGQPVFSISDAAESESAGTMTFTVQRSGQIGGTNSVNFTTANDTATAGSDFTTTSGTLTFNPNETQKTIVVPIINDNVDELNEQFRVNLSNATGDAAIADAQGIGTIADDDTAIVSVGDAAVAENAETASLTVTLSTASNRTVNVSYTTQEGSATSPEDFTQSSGTVSFTPGDTSETISIPIVDDVLTEQTEQFTVTLSEPTSGASLGDATGQVTITDNDVPSLAISDTGVAEGDSGTRNATFNVTLSSATSQTVTVQYTTSNGTATAGSDYTTTSGTLTFSPGELVETINVPVAGDTVQEADETFSVTLSAPTNATISDSAGVGTIQNDDRDPNVSISDASIEEGAADTRNLAFTVSLSEAATGTVTVDYATSDGTAAAGSDYDARSGTVTFTPGDTSETVNVPVRGDTAEEGDETFTVTLSDATGGNIGDGSGVGRILNDDQPPAQQPPAPRTTMVVGDTGISEGDAGTRAVTFTLALSQAATAPISVDVATAPGTALEGSDFRGGGGRITFAPGQTTQAVPIQIVGDTRPEGDEQFTLRLSNASGADIVKAIGTATIANDDIRRRRPGLSFTVTPRRDLTLPHVFRVVGRVTLPSGVSPAEGCGSGRVSAQYKNGGNTISTRRVTLNSQCRFTIRTPFNIRSRLRNARRLKLTVRFHGNRYLSARSANPVFVRVRR